MLHNFHRRADGNQIIQRLNILVVHADAAFGGGFADGRGLVGAVDTDVRLGKTHPACAVSAAGIHGLVDDTEGSLGRGRYRPADSHGVRFIKRAVPQERQPLLFSVHGDTVSCDIGHPKP